MFYSRFYYCIGSTLSVGSTSIGIDNNNKVHISYVAQRGGLKCATNLTGDWQYYTIATEGYRGSSIAIDSNNKIHITTW